MDKLLYTLFMIALSCLSIHHCQKNYTQESGYDLAVYEILCSYDSPEYHFASPQVTGPQIARQTSRHWKNPPTPRLFHETGFLFHSINRSLYIHQRHLSLHSVKRDIYDLQKLIL